jgi:hypothetical protein
MEQLSQSDMSKVCADTALLPPVQLDDTLTIVKDSSVT